MAATQDVVAHHTNAARKLETAARRPEVLHKLQALRAFPQCLVHASAPQDSAQHGFCLALNCCSSPT